MPAVLERVYELGDLPRLEDLLADARGPVQAQIRIFELGPRARRGERRGARRGRGCVCQRCLRVSNSR